MKPFALSITQSLGIVLCYLCLAAHLTGAIWSNDRPKSRNKVSVARGTKQNVGLIDEAMKVLGLDEFFGIYDTDNNDDDDGDESDEFEVKESNTKRHSDDSTNEYSTSFKHKDRKSNKKRTRNNSSNNNNRSKGEPKDKAASSFYSDIESALEQATDKVESLWLQFKQGVHSLIPDLSHQENGNNGEEQIKPTTLPATIEAIETTTEKPITTRKIETSTEEVTTTTTEKPPITTLTTTVIKNITDNPLTNGTTELSNAPAEETTIA